MHKLAAEIEAAITIPFVHIADTTADAVKAAGLTTRRPARDRVHDGAGLLRRAPARATGSTCSCPTPPTARSSTTSSTTSSAAGSSSDGSREEYRRIMRAPGRARRPGHPARLHGDRPARRRGRLARAGLRHHPPARRAGGRAQRGVRRVAAAFQVAVTRVPGSEAELADRGDADLGHERLAGVAGPTRARPPISVTETTSTRQVVLRGARRAAGLEHDLPRVQARGDRAGRRRRC